MQYILMKMILEKLDDSEYFVFGRRVKSSVDCDDFVGDTEKIDSDLDS